MPFTPETLVQCVPNMTPDDAGTVKEIQRIRAGDRVLTGKGNWQVVGEVRSEAYKGPVFIFADGRATPDAELKEVSGWTAASELYLTSEDFSGTVYNLLVAHESSDSGSTPYSDRAFTLANGLVLKGL